jgi:DNA sulfur modification protein DndB
MKNKMILPTLRGVIGNWVYYSSLMSAQQITDWIVPTKDIRESKALDEELQRTLKERKKGIANYLLTTEGRFFNSIIVGVFEGVPDWVEFDLSKASTLIENPSAYKNIQESVGLLIFDGDEQMFAIDGQHRVAGIQIANEIDLEKTQSERIIQDDQYSVIFIAHLDDELGRKRTRKLFSDINNNARPVAEGDKIKIDEEDICAITTRRIYANYKYFDEGKLISLTENESLDRSDSVHFTNLLGLNSVNKELKKLWKKTKNTQPYDEVNVEIFNKISSEFYDRVILNIPEYKQFFVDKTLTIQQARTNNEYLLFRPVGLKLLAKIYSYFIKKYGNEKEFLLKIKKLNFVMPASPLNGILWNDGRMDVNSGNQSFAYHYCLYLLGELSSNDEPKILEGYNKIRKSNLRKLPEKLI